MVIQVVLLSGLSIAGWGQSAGALLAAPSAAGRGYRTIWIYPSGKSMEIISVPGLIVPHASGFWRIGSDWIAIEADQPIEFGGGIFEYYSCEERFWAAPLDAQHTVRPGPHDEVLTHECEVAACGQTTGQIHFVSPRYLAYEQSTEIDCGPHPDAEVAWRVTELPALEAPRISVLDAFGESARVPFLRGEAKAVLEQSEGDKDACTELGDVDFSNWTILRGHGRWVARGYVWVGRMCEYFGEFELPLPLPDTFAKEAELPIPWQTLAAQIPDLDDALVSPKKDLLIALTDQEVAVYRLEGSRLGARLAGRTRADLEMEKHGPYPFDDSGKIIMAQWATGRYVARWTRQIQALRPASHARSGNE